MMTSAPRRCLGSFVLLCALALMPTSARAGEYDSSTPKAAFRSYTNALAAADVEGLKDLVIAGPKHLKMLETLANYNPVEKKFRSIVIKAFPAAAKELPDPTEATLKSIETAEAKITGETATVQTRDSLNVLQLKRDGTKWKIDVQSMFPEDSVEDVTLFKKAMGDVMDAMGDEIAAGKFKSWDDVKTDLGIRVKMRLAMPPSPDDPTTRPGL